MAKFETVSSSIDEAIGSKIETLNEISILSEKLQAEYLSMKEAEAKKVLEEYIGKANNIDFVYDEITGEPKSFDSEFVHGFIISSKETKRTVWNIRYFKNKWNVIFSPNWNKWSIKLWRITPTWVQRIKAVETTAK